MREEIIGDCRLILGDCRKYLFGSIEAGSIDLTVTSPPYDNLRTYNNSSTWGWAEFCAVAAGLWRVTKHGGVVVWVVGDATIKGSETGTSFKQVDLFKKCGFFLHDTMIYQKKNYLPRNHNRYEQSFEYMFVLSKGKPVTFNPFREPVKYPRDRSLSFREKNGHKQSRQVPKKDKIKSNIFPYKTGGGHVATDKIAHQHPAIFPEQLASDHIVSWSNEGDTVFDPFMGSGTTGKMAKLLDRKFIGCEIDEEYFGISLKRLFDTVKPKPPKQQELF